MLRALYRSILRLHPPLFRQRFTQEMLWMFDLQKNFLARLKMLADGVLSLLRQWTLRPEFWVEPSENSAAAGGSPFYMTGRSAPRAGAILDGALISLLTFSAVCFLMEYKWNHPTIIPIISYYRAKPQPAQVFPPPKSPEAKPAPPLYVDGGRVILFVQNPSHTARKP